MGKTPLAAFDIKFFGRLNLHQVANRTGHDVLVVLEVLIVFFELSGHGRERPDDILGNRRLLGNH